MYFLELVQSEREPCVNPLKPTIYIISSLSLTFFLSIMYNISRKIIEKVLSIEYTVAK